MASLSDARTERGHEARARLRTLCCTLHKSWASQLAVKLVHLSLRLHYNELYSCVVSGEVFVKTSSGIVHTRTGVHQYENGYESLTSVEYQTSFGIWHTRVSFL